MSTATLPFGVEPSNVALFLPGHTTGFITHEDHYAVESDAPQDALDDAIARVVAGDPPPGARTLSRADFQRRFQPAEFFAAKQLAQSDAVMAYTFGLFEASQEVRLDHIDTVQFVGYMQAHGILTQERAAQVLE